MSIPEGIGAADGPEGANKVGGLSGGSDVGLQCEDNKARGLSTTSSTQSEMTAEEWMAVAEVDSALGDVCMQLQLFRAAMKHHSLAYE